MEPTQQPNRYMFKTVTEMRESLRRPGTTAIMITYQCRIDLFAQSLLSLLLRTEPYEYLDSVIVIVNGPANGPDSKLQDLKQSFLHDLVTVNYRGKRPPIGIFRLWGIGSGLTHSPCLDSAMAFVTTDYFLSMHDDVIIRNPQWPQLVSDTFKDPTVALSACPHPLMCRLQPTAPPGDPGRRVLLVPHPNTCFLSCRTEPFFEMGGRWLGYCCNVPPFQPADKWSKELEDFYENNVKDVGPCGIDPSVKDPNMPPFVTVGHDVGAWYLNLLWTNNYRATSIAPETAAHVVSASWHSAEDVENKLQTEFAADIRGILKDIYDSPFRDVYEKHIGPIVR